MRRFALVIATMACSDTVSPPSGPPTIERVDVRAESTNVLSATVSFTIHGADSARVSFRSATGDSGITPFQRVVGTTGRVTVLGLRDSTTYLLSLEAARRLGC